jgi:putative sterol carrier protein
VTVRAKPPVDISPLEFFTEWVPASVRNDPARRAKLDRTEATIVFDLQGEGGGTFRLRVEAGSVSGRPGDDSAADLRVHVDVQTWRMLNAGDLSAPEALLRRRLKLEGDFLLGLKLHLILG